MASTEAVKRSSPPEKEAANIMLNKINDMCKPGANGPAFLTVSKQELIDILDLSIVELKAQETLLDVEPPVVVVGDIHGQLQDLVRIFRINGSPSKAKYLFLGDYVDRGKNSIETIILLLCYKTLYPSQTLLLRGNHETPKVNATYGFLTECRMRYDVSIYQTFNDVFAWLPVAAIIGGKIFCCHGGISPMIETMDSIRSLKRPIPEIPQQGLMCDLLWADPDEDATGYQPNPRGCSQVFGLPALEEFLKKHSLDLICRAHQVVSDGYEFFGNRQLVTIFSAPNYEGNNNAGAIMTVSAEMQCKFAIIRPDGKKKGVKKKQPEKTTEKASEKTPDKPEKQPEKPLAKA